MAKIDPSLHQSTLEHFLHDQIFPGILAMEGRLVIHAGATHVEGRAIAFIGKSGLGKSTLTASFDQSGYPLMGDDALVIHWLGDIAAAEATYKSLRLLPDSLHEIFLEPPEHSPAAHYTPKQRVNMSQTAQMVYSPMELTALFFLAQPSMREEIRIAPVKPAEACMALVANSFALNPTDRICAEMRFNEASKLANSIPAFEIIYPRNYKDLPRVREAILRQVNDCRSTARTALR